MANNLKIKTFTNPTDLTKYVNDPLSDVVTIISVFFDSASGQYCLAYTPT